MKKITIAVSVGDINGIGLELLLKSHKKASKYANLIYVVDRDILNSAAKLLETDIPKDLNIYELNLKASINPSQVTKESGLYSYHSFLKAIELVKSKKANAVVTMPIHKDAWSKAGVKYKGHTDMLRDIFQKDAIMMLGCHKMYVGLYTEHIPLKDVTSNIEYGKLLSSLIAFENSTAAKKVAVLGVNPHSGDNGVLGDEDFIIKRSIESANRYLSKEIFYGPIVPDIAFIKSFRKEYNYYFAMYHDQGLAPLKALYFDRSVNISLNLPIVRTSVDHGTAFDIAYNSKIKKSKKSYINAIKSAVEFVSRREL
jgi:4-hydroxythreonine-4-phosphate dehydrogenase